MFGVVYVLKNKINNKIYIGQTTNFDRRMTVHVYHSKKTCKSHYPLYRAIKKYGWENFEKKIIAECNSFEELNKIEEQKIKQYKTTNPRWGYNVQAGGRNISSERLSEVLKKAKSEGTAHDIRVMNVTDNIIYRSGHECARREYPEMKSRNCPIHKVCDPTSNYYFYKGKEYRYLDEAGNIIDKLKRKTGKTAPQKIKCVEDDITFESIEKCFNYYKISKKYFRKCMTDFAGHVPKINKNFVFIAEIKDRVSM